MTEWIESDGGPLIAAPKSLVDGWKGVGRDYELACQLRGYTGIISRGAGQILVLNDEPLRTTALGPETDALIVRWIYAPSEAEVARNLTSIRARLKTAVEKVTFLVREPEQIIFDAAASASEISDSLTLRLTPAEYEVVTFIDEPTPNVSLLVHRFISHPTLTGL